MITKVLIVDDNADMQTSIEDCFSYDDDIQIVGLAHNKKLAIELLEEFKPNLILLSESFQGEQSLEIISQFKEIDPATCIIIMLMFAPTTYRQQAINKGVHGFVQYTKIYSDLLPEIRKVLSTIPCK
ncbi:MAG: response regulator transcription factor [Anaerolineales bacterium]|nr:response regulator transcription factor [Anaerolineales bacterium]